MIPYGRQDIRQDDIDAVVEVLRSDYLTQGPAVGCFEAAVAQAVGAPHAVAMNSATSALHVACLALNLCPERLAAKLRSAEKAGRLPKVIVPVHLAGLSCDMEAIGKLAADHGIRV